MPGFRYFIMRWYILLAILLINTHIIEAQMPTYGNCKVTDEIDVVLDFFPFRKDSIVSKGDSPGKFITEYVYYRAYYRLRAKSAAFRVVSFELWAESNEGDDIVEVPNQGDILSAEAIRALDFSDPGKEVVFSCIHAKDPGGNDCILKPLIFVFKKGTLPR